MPPFVFTKNSIYTYTLVHADIFMDYPWKDVGGSYKQWMPLLAKDTRKLKPRGHPLQKAGGLEKRLRIRLRGSMQTLEQGFSTAALLTIRAR